MFLHQQQLLNKQPETGYPFQYPSGTRVFKYPKIRALDVSYKPDGWLPLLSARSPVTFATLNRAATQFRCLVNRGTMSVNSLPKTVTRHSCGCDLNPGSSVPESSTLITRLSSHPCHSDLEPPYSVVMATVLYGTKVCRKL